MLELLWRYFLELHGDRGFKDDKAMIGGLGKLMDNLYDCRTAKGYNTKRDSIETLGWLILKVIVSNCD
jgi:acetyl-CoA carboxylase carboxyl transferase subunit alpha